MVFARSNLRDSLSLKLRRRSKEPSGPATTTSELPTSWQCTVHLKLLRAFARLRENVVDDLLRSSSYKPTQHGLPPNDSAAPESKLRDEVWKVYLNHAFGRFEAWWKSIAPKNEDGTMRQVKTSTYLEPEKLEAMLQDTKPMKWDEKNLPPLDVIMALHAFMLNPRCFLEDCIRFGMLGLWKAGMPWRLVDQALDNDVDEYLVSSSARKVWEKATKHAWEEDTDQLILSVACPLCDKVTTLTTHDRILDLTKGETTGRKCKNELRCKSCKYALNTSHLQVHKFHRAIEDLQQRDIPMPGSILSMSGTARSALKANELPEMFALNRLMKGEVGDKVLAMTSQEQLRKGVMPTIQDLHHIISNAQDYSNDRFLKTAVNRAIYQATDNYSIFALDLPAAIFRQCSFIEQMEAIDWLHSPALEYTMDSLIKRYELFFKIMGTNKNNVAVPTYAVDLAWHTHQLSPASYYTYSLTHADNIFIDHDDRIDDGVRTDAFDWTSKQYKLLTNGEDYSQCLCWHCALAHEHLADKADALALNEHGHVNLEKYPVLGEEVSNKIARSQYLKLEEDFAVACRRAKGRGETVPNQKMFLQGYTWLYPQAIPVIRG